MGTARTWREMEARRKTLSGRPTWNPGGGRSAAATGQLEEFDWESLRRVWEDDPADSHEARADRSLRLLDRTLAHRRRNRRLLQLAGLMLAPVVLVFAIRGLRQALA